MENQTEVSQVPGSQIEYIKFFLALPNIFGMIFFSLSTSATAKSHSRLDHICYDTAPVANPLGLSCYTDEDGVGQIKRLAQASNPNGLDFQVLNRYAAYCCVKWLRKLTE